VVSDFEADLERADSLVFPTGVLSAVDDGCNGFFPSLLLRSSDLDLSPSRFKLSVMLCEMFFHIIIL